MKVFILKIILFFLTIILTQNGIAQNKYLFSNKITDLQFLYNYHIPSGKIAERFGNFSSVGAGAMLKSKNNWVLGYELNYLFGQKIKEETILNQLVTSGNYISNTDGFPANYSVNMRGISSFVRAGRLISVKKFNQNTGFLLLGGIGLLNHRINFQTQEGNAPPIDADYQKGYDRFSSGIAFNQFVGYIYHSQNRFVNLFLGIDFTQAFTYNRRGFNYDTQQFDKQRHLDVTTSFRFGWTIPIYMNTREQNEFQFK
jgi:hypothetical protein